MMPLVPATANSVDNSFLSNVLSTGSEASKSLPPDLGNEQEKKKLAGIAKIARQQININKGNSICHPISLTSPHKKAKALYEKAKALANDRKYEAAIKLFEKALLLTQNSPHSMYVRLKRRYESTLFYLTPLLYTNYARIMAAHCCFEIGKCYSSGIKYINAVKWLKKALVKSKAFGNNKVVEEVVVSAHCYLGIAYMELGKYREAEEHFKEELRIEKETNQTESVAKSYGNLGVLRNKMGLYNDAIDWFNKSLDTLKHIKLWGVAKTEVEPLMARMYGNLGIAHGGMGNILKACQYDHKAEVIFLNNEDKYRCELSGIYSNLGIHYLSLGKYAEAIKYCDKGINISKKLNDGSAVARGHENLGNLYATLGQNEKALSHHLAAYSFFKRNKLSPEEARACRNIGCAYEQIGQYEKAIEFHNKALQLSRDLGISFLEITTLNNLGNVYSILGKCKMAENYAKEALLVCGRNRAYPFKKIPAELYENSSNEIAPSKPISGQEIIDMQDRTRVVFSPIGGEAIYIWVISPELKKIKCKRVDITQTLFLKVKSFCNSTEPSSDRMNTLKYLYNHLMQPVKSLLQKDLSENPVVFVSDDYLFNILFHTKALPKR